MKDSRSRPACGEPPDTPSSRRRFLATAVLAPVALAVSRSSSGAADRPPENATELQGRPPALAAEDVFGVVRVAHSDPAAVTTLLDREPRLVNATWDWGGGDWETPLGAAGHMGRRDIARLLLDHGARLDLFAAAMLGELETVRAAVGCRARIVNTRGPHGFTLLYHAAISGNVALAEVIRPHLDHAAHDCNQALQAAARDGHAAMTEWLLKHGATDPNVRDARNRTPLLVAQENGYRDVVTLLRAHGGIE